MNLRLINLFWFCCCALSCLLLAAQQPSDQLSLRELHSLPMTPLAVSSRVELSSISSPFIVLPVVCGPNYKIFLRMADSDGVTDLLSVSPDGKTLVNFAQARMTDVTNPRTAGFFVSDSGVYILTSGSLPQDKMIQMQKREGRTERQQAFTIEHFIARFGFDGAYQGAVRLEVPFRPYQVGVFANGYFLVAGATADNQARVALVKPTGQFHRFIEILGDIHLKGDSHESQSGDSSGIPTTGKRFLESFAGVVRTSLIVADGPNLLLLRKGQKLPIFSISPGGEVIAVNPDIPEGFTIMDLKPAGNSWVVLCTRRISDDAGLAFETFALNPATGAQIRRYAYPQLMGAAMACTDGNEFTFLLREDDKLKLVKLTSSRIFNSSAQQ